MHMSAHIKALATTLAVAAIVAPTASARPAEAYLPSSVNAGSDEPAATSSSAGFDWADAGVGAAGMLSLLGLGTGVAVATRRARRGQQAIS
jgi:hypothetical protein